jgi:ketosteroid isomerase-like protein
MVSLGLAWFLVGSTGVGGSAQRVAGPVPSLRMALEARYAALHQAYRTKDVSAILRVMAPDFAWMGSDHRMMDRQDTEEALRDWMKRQGTVRGIATRIDKLNPSATGATATVTTTILTTVVDQRGGKHSLINTQTNRDTWVKLVSAWRMRRSETLSAKAMMDGKPVR